jgi:glutamyl-tRNA synthetase
MSGTLVVTRFAPSPSGELHLGNARTALYNYLLARRRGGRFILRVEDTDQARSSDAHVRALTDDLHWLGLNWELGPDLDQPEADWRQSARGAVYEPRYQQLIAGGQAYPCFCTALELDLSRRAQLAAGRPPRYAGTCRNLTGAERVERLQRGLKPSLRFAVPAGRVVQFDDLVHGPQNVRSDDIGDFIIRREDGTSAFFFCNAVDDASMGITDLLRGDDHLSNTPRQLLLLEALGLTAPRYGHVSLITGADGAPLSKRHGASTLRELREQGYSAATINNLLFRLGHSTPNNQLLSLEQMAEHFDTGHLQRASAHLDETQLRHWQGEWLRSLTPEAAREWLRSWLPQPLDDTQLQNFQTAVLPNVVLADDVRLWASVFYGDELAMDAEAQAAIAVAGPEFFAAAAAAVPETGAELSVLRTATGCKGAAFFMPLRAALTGRLHGPEVAPLLRALPVAQVRRRLSAHAGGA